MNSIFNINMPYGARIYKDNTLVFFNRQGNPLGVAGETLEQAFVLELMAAPIEADPHTDALEHCQAAGTAEIIYRTSTSGIAYREVIFFTDDCHPTENMETWVDYLQRILHFISLVAPSSTPQIATHHASI
jgi:hypothetical protein